MDAENKMNQNVKWVAGTEHEVGGGELVVGLLGGHAELHVGGVAHVHEPDGNYQLVVVAVHLPPVGELGYHRQRTSHVENVQEMLERASEVLGEVRSSVEDQRQGLHCIRRKMYRPSTGK